MRKGLLIQIHIMKHSFNHPNNKVSAPTETKGAELETNEDQIKLYIRLSASFLRILYIYPSQIRCDLSVPLKRIHVAIFVLETTGAHMISLQIQHRALIRRSNHTEQLEKISKHNWR
jgi:hypothetical protein